jgi:hypothetical protein
MAAGVHFMARVFAHIAMVLAGAASSCNEEYDGHHGKQDLLFHQRSFLN